MFFIFLAISILSFALGTSIQKGGSADSYAGMGALIFFALGFGSLAGGGILTSIVSWINHSITNKPKP